MDRIDKYLSTVPSLVQKRIQRSNFNAFIHYGLNTFTGDEWGNGKVSVKEFNPTAQDTDQWCKTLKAAGVTGVILTAKHHDGFCLWRTQTTEYSVKNSPYKNGNGDVVKEVADSCRKYSLNFGIYLSPWDRNNPHYGVDIEKYNDFYIAQLTELLTDYGDIFCVWLDGACGAYMDGKQKQIYDFARYYAKIRELQPNACISNCGPDVRWVGNEGGYARESEWNVVPKFAFDIQTIIKNSQQNEDQKAMQKGVDIVSSDLGSREFLSNFNEFMWYPAEVDVSIRPGWFYHKSQDLAVRKLNNLMYIYYTSVGGNSLLLLNVPPNKEGKFADKDVTRLDQLGQAIKSAFAKEVVIESISAPKCEPGREIEGVLDNGYDPLTYSSLRYYTPEAGSDEYTISLKFAEESVINKVKMAENTDFSQRIEEYKIYIYHNGKQKKVYDGTIVGYNKIAVFKKAYKADRLDIVITKCRKKPYLEYIGVFISDGFIPKQSFIKKIELAVQKINYKVYVNMENKKNV